MTLPAALTASMLPPVMQNFARLIGLAATQRIIEKHGGRRLYIPMRFTADHPLAQLIGFDNLAKLSVVYGLEDHFSIPRAAQAMRHVRNEKIRAEHPSKSASMLAEEHQMTERQIWKILAEQTSPPGRLK